MLKGGIVRFAIASFAIADFDGGWLDASWFLGAAAEIGVSRAMMPVRLDWTSRFGVDSCENAGPVARKRIAIA